MSCTGCKWWCSANPVRMEIVETSYGLKAACRQPLGCGHVTQENRLCLQMSNMGMLIGHMNFWNPWKHGRLPLHVIDRLHLFARSWNRLSRVVSFKQSCTFKTSFCQSNSWYLIIMYACCMYEQTFCRIMPDFLIYYYFIFLVVAKVAIIDIKMWKVAIIPRKVYQNLAINQK